MCPFWDGQLVTAEDGFRVSWTSTDVRRFSKVLSRNLNIFYCEDKNLTTYTHPQTARNRPQMDGLDRRGKADRGSTLGVYCCCCDMHIAPRCPTLFPCGTAVIPSSYCSPLSHLRPHPTTKVCLVVVFLGEKNIANNQNDELHDERSLVNE